MVRVVARQQFMCLAFGHCCQDLNMLDSAYISRFLRDLEDLRAQ